MFNWSNLVSQMFNGLVLGALLALISSGLTIIYGTLGVLNLAHGAMFMIGGYAGLVAYQYTHSFLIAVIAGSLFVMVLGIVMERVIIRHFYQRPHEDQLLVTFGLAICFVEIVRLIFSSQSQVVPAPPMLQGITNLGFMFYPTYQLAVVGIGAMAAGFAGIINAPVVSMTPGVGDDILVETFVVVVIGGVGSFPGAILGGLIAAEIISITSMFNPGYAYVMLFAAMTLVLVLRPHGLLGVQGRE